MRKIKKALKKNFKKEPKPYKTIEQQRLIGEGKDPEVERMLNDMERDRFKRGYYK